MGTLFKRGFEAAREEQDRQEKRRANFGKRISRFMLTKDDGEAKVHFLMEEPVTFMEHTLKFNQGGKEVYENHLCTNDSDCPYCKAGNRPSFKGAMLVVDLRHFSYVNKQGKKIEGDKQLRLYVAGTKILGQLDRLANRYGLSSRDYFITRSGSGTSTSYMFDRTDDTYKFTDSEIEDLLPEALREEFNGTEDSLVKIVQDQLLMTLENAADNNNTHDDDGGESSDSSKNLVGVTDDSTSDAEESRGSSHKLRPSVKKKSLFKRD